MTAPLPRAGRPARRPNRRGIPLALAALAATVGLSSTLPAAQAEPEPGPGAEDGAGLTGDGVTEYEAGRYIVVLAEAPAAAVPGLKVAGGEFDATAPGVDAYTRRLERAQRALAGEVGVDVDRQFSIAANAFTADLSADQATDLATDRRVLLVERTRIVEADTWNTPDFLGMTGRNGTWQAAGGRRGAGAGTVIGVIDSGIWPESESFSGRPLSETPRTKWDISMTGTATRMEKSDGRVFHGECETGEEWTTDLCNTKLIGARYFVEGYGEGDVLEEDYLSTRDGNGHGTHTASTAGGNVVSEVSVEDRVFGKISGMAPGAKIAAYKALWATEAGTASGSTEDLVAAVEAATTDGVDVINYSISGSQDTVLDAVEITFVGAAEAGIFIATSAGNNGPDASTVAHNSPWVTTTASSTHATFENTLVLGNGKRIVGASVNDERVRQSPLVMAEDIAADPENAADAALCGPESLDEDQAEGKIVVCLRGQYDRVAKSAEVARAGGIGMVLANPSPNSLDADFHAVPSVHIDENGTAKVQAYVETAGDDATASIRPRNITKRVTPVPQVSGFSSRGPAASDESDLLKPDIAAPGTSVLAAVAPPSNSDRDFDLYSGTSMASPHIAGLAAFLQGLHPRWRPMKLKSAMMTTAGNLRKPNGKRSRDHFAQGAGQVEPRDMLDPGLYVMSGRTEWYGYITGLGLNTGVPAIEPNEVNVPSMAEGHVFTSVSFTRRFTADRPGTWKVSANVPGFSLTPSASTLVAKRKNDTESLDLTFERTTAKLGKWAKGYVTLTGPTKVRLPVALRPVSVQAPATVEGEGVDGSEEVPVTGGFDGEVQVSTSGLAKGQVFQGDVPEDDSVFECVTIGEGNELAQFDLHAPDPTSDLDMYIYASESCELADIYAVAGEAATPSAGETFTAEGLPAGSYVVEVNAYAAGEQGDPVPYDLRVYDVGGTTDEGDLTVDPNPVPVQTGQETSFEVSWTGLEPQSYYLGVLGYAGSPAPTFLYVETGLTPSPTLSATP